MTLRESLGPLSSLRSDRDTWRWVITWPTKTSTLLTKGSFVSKRKSERRSRVERLQTSSTRFQVVSTRTSRLLTPRPDVPFASMTTSRMILSFESTHAPISSIPTVLSNGWELHGLARYVVDGCKVRREIQRIRIATTVVATAVQVVTPAIVAQQNLDATTEVREEDCGYGVRSRAKFCIPSFSSFFLLSVFHVPPLSIS